MKTAMSAQLGQQLNLTPQLLQSIRLLQLDGLQLELEVRRALDMNPMLELEDNALQVEPDAATSGQSDSAAEVASREVAAFDELKESSLWDVRGASWNGGDSDRLQNMEAGHSSDPHVRVLQQLALEMDATELTVIAFWLEQLDEAGYLGQPAAPLAKLASQQFGISVERAEALRQRLLQGEYPGLAAADLRECLTVQLAMLPGRVPGRAIACRLVEQCLPLLALHDYPAMARHLQLDESQVREAVRVILSLQPRPGELPVGNEATGYVIPDVVAWHADCAWRVALNPATTPRVSVSAGHERLLDRAQPGEATDKLRDLLQQARWLSRGLSMRHDTLLRAARAIVERQAAFLTHGEEAIAPLTLKEIAEEIGMHESTISRITTGKYIQTPRGTFELKRFFAVRLEGANVSGAAVRAMVRRLIDSEPAGKPLADDAIAGLLARQGIHIARRTVAKYREQLDIAPARERRRGNVMPMAKAG